MTTNSRTSISLEIIQHEAEARWYRVTGSRHVNQPDEHGRCQCPPCMHDTMAEFVAACVTSARAAGEIV